MDRHLYASWACPFSHRVLIVRKLLGLEDRVGVSIADPVMDAEGWVLSEGEDRVNGRRHVRDLYVMSDSSFAGRATLPVLWSTAAKRIESSDSRAISRILDAMGDASRTFYPEAQRAAIDGVMERIAEPINEGVYRAGFARTQAEYLEAVTVLFEALDYWEEVLAEQRYLAGNRVTLADWCMFTTLLRFDLVYHGLFKCNVRRIVDYPNLYNYLKDLYQLPGVRETCRFDEIKRHYYQSHPSLNPNGIVPRGPLMALGAPHDRK
jgi:putative glutathione S-transferase